MTQPMTVWGGPVGAFQMPGTKGLGTIKFVNCTGDGSGGSAQCRAFADSWADAAGRRVPGMLRMLGLPDDGGDLFLAAYSAGGHIWKRVFASPADRARVRGVLLADAMYSSGGTPKNPEPIAGFVDYAIDVMRDQRKIFVATASANPNKSYGSGAEVMDATRKAIEQRAGVTFRDAGKLPLAEQPARALVSPSGNVLFLDYGMSGGGHGSHPRRAPEIWDAIIIPWLKHGPSFSLQSPWLAGAVGFAFGATALTLALKHGGW